MRFFVGLHHPQHGRHFERACISVRALLRRRKPVECDEVLVDSGAFSELVMYGKYRFSVSEYRAELRRLHGAGVVKIAAAVAQDYMCEPFMLAKTGLTVADHQRLTIERYDELVSEWVPCPIMPVLQGYTPRDYQAHIEAYGDRLTPGMWVGVGSVCKRNTSPEQVLAVLEAIKAVRPDLRLHGFGLKRTALECFGVFRLLESADSMAWSFAARHEGRDGNDWREAMRYSSRIMAIEWAPWQMTLPLYG